MMNPFQLWSEKIVYELCLAAIERTRGLATIEPKLSENCPNENRFESVKPPLFFKAWLVFIIQKLP